MVRLLCLILAFVGHCCLAESAGVAPTYFYIGPDKVTWNEAIRLCESINMRIASLETKAKYDLLYNWIIANGIAYDTVYKGLWISLNRIPDQNQKPFNWYWITGEPLSYVHYLPGDPNNADGNEQCNFALTYNNSVVIADVGCSKLYWPLCEKIPEKDCNNNNSSNNQGQCAAPTVNVSCK